MMKMEDAMKKRHTVRKFQDKKLSDSFIDVLNERVEYNNQKYHLNMRLIVNDGNAIPLFIRLFVSRGVKNYVILSGEDSTSLEERIGYAGTDIMLFAQTLGLNSWWISGTYRKGHVRKKIKQGSVKGIVAIGFGVDNGIEHKQNKTPLEVSNYVGGDTPDWFRKGVDAALLAPTALNKQKFVITGTANRVKIDYEEGAFSNIDKGIIKYHFELGAGSDNFSWEE